MPRPKKPGAGEPKKRSRNGCWPCKARKVKCGEEKPQCANCERQGETCDYSIRLNWGGRSRRSPDNTAPGSRASSAARSPHIATMSFDDNLAPLFPSPTPRTPPPPSHVGHARSRSATSVTSSSMGTLDSDLGSWSRPQSHSMLAFDGMADLSFQPQETRRLPTSAPFSARQHHESHDHPSLEDSGFVNLNCGSANYPYDPDSPGSMPPPTRNASTNHRQVEAGDSIYTRYQRDYSVESSAPSDAYSPQPGPSTSYSPYMTMPLTPNSSIGSDEPVVRTVLNQAYPPSDLRRVSVQSLLAGPSSQSEGRAGRQYPIQDDEYTIYGYDLGHHDFDTPRNRDEKAIEIYSPRADLMELDDPGMHARDEPRAKDIAFEKGGYYANPVPIKIPKKLEPLPSILLENPMNLLYFHHFLNHTARILVPHDCEQNPFREILPEMAVRDENIMSLLLAYSASHRARMLAQPEPVNRIAHWVRDVFPRLRASLATATQPSDITNNILAPAIMMASLEIICPNTFEVPVSWSDHLTVARQLIIARGGPRAMHPADPTASFLLRWFAYLDVVGALSSGRITQPLGAAYWAAETDNGNDEGGHNQDAAPQIDCLTGFTPACVANLARIAALAAQVQPLRLDTQGNIRSDFRPSPAIAAQAERIRRGLEAGAAAATVTRGCNHGASSSPSPFHLTNTAAAWDAAEIHATNEMFHHAGLIHLHRRVLNAPRSHPAVQHAVRAIASLLHKVRRGSTAEACLLFPIFSAGCDALDSGGGGAGGVREKIMERLRGVEGFGMVQVGRARGILERVWESGGEWEGLVEGEFFG